MTPRHAAIVFVHGFHSSAETWSHFTDLIKEDGDLADFHVHAFEYASPLVSPNPLRRIPNFNDIADGLGTFIGYSAAKDANLVLVSHSQGGLVVQRFLARMLRDGRGEELARIRRIVMFACPNSGSEFAALPRRLLPWKNPQERELRPLAEAITDTHRTVLNQIVHATRLTGNSCPIPIVAYAGASDGVVTPTSARSVFPEVGVLPGDHFSIIQPDSPSHPSYAALKQHLLAARSAEPPAASPPASAPAAEGTPHHPRVSRAEPDRPIDGQLPPAQVTGIVDRLVAVPGMTELEFRQHLYDLLPPPLVSQLRRNSVPRLEAFALVRACVRFAHLDAWERLAGGLSALAPEDPSVAELIRYLSRLGLITRPPDPTID